MFGVRVYSADAEGLYALRAADLPERQNRHDRHRRLGVSVLSINKDVLLTFTLPLRQISKPLLHGLVTPC